MMHFLKVLVPSIPLPFEHSQTMKFTQQQKLIGLAIYGLAFHCTCMYYIQIVAAH